MIKGTYYTLFTLFTPFRVWWPLDCTSDDIHVHRDGLCQRASWRRTNSSCASLLPHTNHPICSPLVSPQHAGG